MGIVDEMLSRHPRDTEAEETNALREVMQEIALAGLLHDRIEMIDLDSARADVDRFIKSPEQLAIWSKKYFHELADRVVQQSNFGA